MIDRSVLAGRVGEWPYTQIRQTSDTGKISYHVLVKFEQHITPPEGVPDLLTEDRIAELITRVHPVDPVTRAAALEAALRHMIRELDSFRLATMFTEPRHEAWAEALQQALRQELKG